MKVLHVIMGLRKAAGTSTFCGEVCNQLVARGYDVTIAVLDPAVPDRYPLDSRVQVISIESLLNNGCQSPLTNHYSIVHIHGLWSPNLHRVSSWAHAQAIPVIWSTHGMTAPWSLHHKWLKKLPAWLLYQKWDLKRTAAIHCTMELEVDWNKRLGFKNCFVAPLGTSLPNLCSTPTPKTYTSTSKTLLFVGRIYPVKALDRLIEAYARVEASLRHNWVLRLVGPDQAGHMSELKNLCKSLCVESSVVFAGPKFNDELNDEYANCDCLALVSHTENFGATVVDAMSYGKPVITSTKTPWKTVADNGCGWCVCNDVGSLSAALADMMRKGDATRAEMGARGRALVEAYYTWSAVCDKIIRGYESVLG